MARKKEKRRISKEQLALAVRKHFNGAAVSEIDVVVELVYKVRNQGRLTRVLGVSSRHNVVLLPLTHRLDKSFRMRSAPVSAKKQ